MKAVQFSEYGGPEVLQVVDADEPHAGPGQVRIAVRAAGVNPSKTPWPRPNMQFSHTGLTSRINCRSKLPAAFQ
jgi:NADPH:quinone reductase-like Zn-dependent oxidoreductase